MIAVDLMPEWKVNDLVLTDYPYSVDADSTVDIGEPEVEVVTIPGSLADGDLEREIRSGNRTYVLSVYIEGPTMGDLAENEAALRRELKKPSVLLTHDPGDGLGFASVYEVQVARMKPDRQDLHESHLIRRVTLTFTCGPFARSVDAVTVPALAYTSGSVVVDTCDATTGWSTGIIANTDTLSTSGGAVWSTDTSGNDAASLYRAASIDVSAHPFFVLEWKATPSAIGFLVLGIPAATNQFPSELRRVALGDGWFRSTWSVAAGDLNSGFQLSFSGTGVDALGIREVVKSGVLPGTTPRQLSRIIEPGGTERTPASIHVQTESGTGQLTQVIVHTCPEDGSGYSPPLRRWRTVASTGPVTTDATTYSGGYEPIAFVAGGFIAEIPTSALPEGGYTLLARVKLSASAPANVTIFYSTSTLFPGSVIQDGFTNGSETITLTDTNWTLVPITTLSLPSVRTQAGKVQVVLQTSTTHSQVYLDEAWLFREDVDCATSITNNPLPHLWLDSPDADSPVSTVWIGDGLSTKVHPSTGLVAQGSHILSPGGTAVFTAALVDNPATDATFFERWPNYAAS